MNMKKTIKIKFVDFWSDDFGNNNNLFVRILRERYNVVICDDPDYYICAEFGDEVLKNPKPVRIFFTGENRVPDFNTYDYAIGFDHLTFEDRYIRFPLYYFYASDCQTLLNREAFTRHDISKREGFCATVISNWNGAPERKQLFEAINAYKTISSGGRFMNNVGGPVKDKVAFQSKYKFVLASENSSQRGYCTEKLIQAFMSNAIPIYWGDPLVGLTFNTESFINCMDYPSFDAVVDRIKEIDNDDDLYLHMLNAPIFINPQTPAIDFKILREFLYHIFDQDLATVKRRNTSNIFARQTQELLDYKYAYFHPFKSAYKRIIERLKRLPNKLRKVQSR